MHEVSIDGITPPTNHLAVLTSPLLLFSSPHMGSSVRHAFNCTHMAYTAYQGSASCLRAPREASNDFFFVLQTLTKNGAPTIPNCTYFWPFYTRSFYYVSRDNVYLGA
jgi:hypothetical protein